MSLDEFFAKKAKLKTKKKQTSKDLMNKLMKNDIQKDSTEINVPDATNKSYIEQSAEWEIIDDELDLDFEALKLKKLINECEEQSAESKCSRGNDGEAQQEKKAWGSKPLEEVSETPAVEEPAVVEEPPKPNVYVPLALRKLKSAANAKPNVSSAMDFPTLDSAITSDTSSSKKAVNTTTDSDTSWQQAGVRQVTRRPDMISVPIHNPAPSSTAYVPPYLRSNMNEGLQIREKPNSSSLGTGFQSRSRDSNFVLFRRNDQAEQSPAANQPWVRGQKIESNAVTIQFPNQSNAHSGSATGRSSDAWVRNVNMKTYKESSMHDKPGFELVQSNRFAGLGET